MTSFGDAAFGLRPLLEGSQAAFEANGPDRLTTLRRAALIALREGESVEDADIDAFWLFLSRLTALRSKLRHAHILELTKRAAENGRWARRFWLTGGEPVPVWVLVNPSRLQTQEDAKVAAAQLLASCPSADVGRAWLSAGPEDFRCEVSQLRPEASEASRRSSGGDRATPRQPLSARFSTGSSPDAAVAGVASRASATSILSTAGFASSAAGADAAANANQMRGAATEPGLASDDGVAAAEGHDAEEHLRGWDPGQWDSQEPVASVPPRESLPAPMTVGRSWEELPQPLPSNGELASVKQNAIQADVPLDGAGTARSHQAPSSEGPAPSHHCLSGASQLFFTGPGRASIGSARSAKTASPLASARTQHKEVPAPPPAAPSTPPSGGAIAVAACGFCPDSSARQAPSGGTPMRVVAGQRLEVLGRHPAGWVRARLADGTAEGWVPEGVLRADGEIARGLAKYRVLPPSSRPEGAELQLGVSEGALLKLIRQEMGYWLVETEGCRGYIPKDAVREFSTEDKAEFLFGARRTSRVSRISARVAIEGVAAAAAAKPAERTTDRGSRATRGTEEFTPWACGLWGYQASYYASAVCITLGLAGVLSHWREENDWPEAMQSIATSGRLFYMPLYSLVLGCACLAFNKTPVCKKFASSSDSFTTQGTPVRGAVVLLLSIPLFLSGPTFLAGVAVAFVALLFFLSAYRREKGEAPENRKAAPISLLPDSKDGRLKEVPLCSPVYWRLWWELQGIRGERPKVILVFAWAMLTVALGIYKFIELRSYLWEPTEDLVSSIQNNCWLGSIMEEANGDCSQILDLYQDWIPVAKLFGNGLNFNCALIVLMVCQHFIMRLNKHGQKSKLWTAKICKKLPTHKNLIFHKGLAAAIAILSFPHIFAHFMAHSYTLGTFSRFGHQGKWVTLSIWATGAIILMCIVVMYPVSREYVKKTWFEAFINTHVVCATTFMVCLLWHAPHFWFWAIFPLGLFLIDRYLRWQIVTLASVKLLEVRWRPPVMQLVFDTPWNYQAGQYVWLCCPSIAQHEKHPFTISSAPETGLLCLAIKCWPGGWTERLRDFLAELCDVSQGVSKGFTFTFEETDWLTGQSLRGKSCLPDGSPLLLIDGPHAAPAMRYLEFEVIILAAAGIGLTPASSVLRQLLQYRWLRDADALPRSVYFCWLCACAEVPAFEWFTDELSDLEVAAAANKDVHGSAAGPLARHAELHLFVTRAPPHDDKKAVLPPKPKPARLYGSAEPKSGKVARPYGGPELLRWMQHPATKSDTMPTVLRNPAASRPNQAGHTFVWNGRPHWTELFKHVAGIHSSKTGRAVQVGVFFCGAPAIGKDLKQCCRDHSNGSICFRLLKESF